MIVSTNCEPSLINYSESKSRFWNHEASERQRIPICSNTRSGKKSFTKCAINSPTPFRGKAKPTNESSLHLVLASLSGGPS